MGGFTVIIGLISVQVGLELDLSTGTELGNFARKLDIIHPVVLTKGKAHECKPCTSSFYSGHGMCTPTAAGKLGTASFISLLGDASLHKCKEIQIKKIPQILVNWSSN